MAGGTHIEEMDWLLLCFFVSCCYMGLAPFSSTLHHFLAWETEKHMHRSSFLSLTSLGSRLLVKHSSLVEDWTQGSPPCFSPICSYSQVGSCLGGLHCHLWAACPHALDVLQPIAFVLKQLWVYQAFLWYHPKGKILMFQQSKIKAEFCSFWLFHFLILTCNLKMKTVYSMV